MDRQISAMKAVHITFVPAMALLLAACGGGGGGNVRPPDPPPTAPPPTPPVVHDPDPAFSKHLIWTNAGSAHDAGLTGQGVRIGIVDSGVNRNHPSMQGRVVANLTYISSNGNDLTKDDVVGHGTAVAQAAAGAAFGSWPGGVAPGAEIVSARIIQDKRPDDDGSGQGNEVNGALGLAPIHQDLINRGVKIMNNSWGGLYWTNPAATAPIAAEYRPFIIGNGGLVVFSTGNSGFANPSDMAALPSQLGTGGSTPAADLERGWLAVGALDKDNPRQLAEYSNACGLAMNYCLVAPGTVTVTGTDDGPTNPSYWNWSGTSLSAPLVSGAAALVWEAFPYFDNDLVRQTLLGTADDLGDPGVDPVFGYGALNIGAAVKGPAQFDWGDVTVNLSGGTSTWSNDITGAGGLVKRGAGTLVLSGWTGYTGVTRASGGTLSVDGQLNGDAVIDAGATLRLGSGANGSITNHGVLAQQGAGFSRTITGDFVQSASAQLAFLVGAPLHVHGAASLAGELQVAGIASGYVHNSREDVVVAHGGLNGQFATLTSASSVFLEAVLDYDANRAWLDITRLDITAAAMAFGQISPMSLGAAVRMEEAFGRIDAQQEDDDRSGKPIAEAFIALASEFQRTATEADAVASLRSLSGELHAAADVMTFDAIDINRRALSSRFGGLVDQPNVGGDWFQRLGSRGEGIYGAADFELDGWMLGSDLRLGEHGVAGFAFGETRANNHAGSRLDHSQDRQAQSQFYLGAIHGNTYALGQMGFGRYDRQMRRQLLLGAQYHGVASEYSGDFLATNLELGHRFGLGAASLTPYVGADHARVEREGFAETGANGFGLRAGDSIAERTQAIAGLRSEYRWNGHDGRGFALRGYTEWQHALHVRGMQRDASFVGVESWAPLAGMPMAESGGIFGLGFDMRLSRDAKLSLGYDQRFGSREPMRVLRTQFTYGF